jgi:PII-like signaling protein
MTKGFKGERTLMRIHIGADDRWEDRPLYEAIVELLREEHFAGATAFRGVLGFGASAVVHRSSIFRLSSDLPIVVECVDTHERIEGILPRLDEMIGGGLITLEKVRVIMYRPDLPEAERTGSWPIDLGR